MPALIDLFSLKDLIPHGYCLSWSPVLLWLHVISDLLIMLAYYFIPLILIHFLRQRKDLLHPWLIAMFAGFIVACGTTHLLSAIIVWIPLYWLDGLLKGFTAVLSTATAVLMLWLVPKVLALPSAAKLQAEIRQRETAEEALAFLNPELDACHGEIKVTGEWPELFASRDELTRLLQNLIGNALKYHEKNKPPQVHIHGTASESEVSP
jgi:hypothetical protein